MSFAGLLISKPLFSNWTNNRRSISTVQSIWSDRNNKLRMLHNKVRTTRLNLTFVYSISKLVPYLWHTNTDISFIPNAPRDSNASSTQSADFPLAQPFVNEFNMSDDKDKHSQLPIFDWIRHKTRPACSQTHLSSHWCNRELSRKYITFFIVHPYWF